MADSEVNVKPFSYTLHLVSKKWKMYILFWLWKKDVMRYGELKRALSSVTHKMLSSQLKELESDGLIIRKEYPQVPPKVEYSLSKLGKSLMPVLQTIAALRDKYDLHITAERYVSSKAPTTEDRFIRK